MVEMQPKCTSNASNDGLISAIIVRFGYKIRKIFRFKLIRIFATGAIFYCALRLELEFNNILSGILDQNGLELCLAQWYL